MDRLESLTSTLSQITMYDIKSMYNQAKNVVFNVSEMEAKVRDATNDEAWGASSTLMQEIAQGTFNFQNFNEIMPCIYARFMEKEARQWRQIYKALQLLEYLVKNGSERVVDDARSHIATIKMLRNFYYIDEKGKDQGLNVRNRSKELVELLGDVEKIRTERRKAKANKTKYIGTGNDSMGFGSGGGRYGGFGNDSGYGGSGGSGGPGGSGGTGASSSGWAGSSGGYGGDYSSRDYGDYSSGGSGGFRDSGSRKGYEEYEAGDDDTVAARGSGAGPLSSPTSPRSSTTVAPPAKAKAPEPAPIPNLLDFDDFSTPAPVQAAPRAAASSFDNDDDFGGFQDAPSPGVSTSSFATAPLAPIAPAVPNIQKPASPPIQPTYQQPTNNLFNMLASTTSSPPSMAANRPPSYMTSSTMTPTMTPSVQTQGSIFGSPVIAVPSRGTPVTTPGGFGGSTQAKATSSGGNFDDLWSMSLGSKSSSTARPNTGPTQGKSMKDIEKEKAQASIWGGASQAQTRPPMGSGFGSFGSSTGSNPPPSSGGGLEDLLG